jgi:hypothetical protein
VRHDHCEPGIEPFSNWHPTVRVEEQEQEDKNPDLLQGSHFLGLRAGESVN